MLWRTVTALGTLGSIILTGIFQTSLPSDNWVSSAGCCTMHLLLKFIELDHVPARACSSARKGRRTVPACGKLGGLGGVCNVLSCATKPALPRSSSTSARGVRLIGEEGSGHTAYAYRVKIS